MKNKIPLAILLAGLSLPQSTPADDNFPIQLSFMTGTISTSFSESESTLEPSDGTDQATETPYSGSSSSLPIEFGGEIFSTPKRSYFLRGGGPLVASGTDRLFYVNTGINFYLSPLGSPLKVSTDKFNIRVIPKFRYYIGIQAGTSYLIYSTKSQTKSDILFELGGQGGGIYSISTQWGLKAEASIMKGTGALVSSMTMKVLLGATYSINL